MRFCSACPSDTDPNKNEMIMGSRLLISECGNSHSLYPSTLSGIPPPFVKAMPGKGKAAMYTVRSMVI